MGRGLSDLQKTILRLAYQNHVDEGRTPPRYQVLVDLEYPDPPEKPPVLDPDDPVAAVAIGLHRDNTADTVYWLAYDNLKTEVLNKAREPLRDLLPEQNRVLIHREGESIIAGEFLTRAAADAHAHQIRARGASPRIDILVGDEGADLYTYEVLIAAFGFGEQRKIESSGRPAPLRWELVSMRATHGKFFDRGKIGEARYNTALVSVSRAFARLEERGLVLRLYGDRDWMGVDLTPEGVKVTRGLLANSLDNTTTISQ